MATDIAIYIVLIVFTLSLGLLSLLGSRSVAWMIFALFGALIGAYSYIATAQSNSISSSGTALVTAGDPAWLPVLLLPVILAAIDLILGIVGFLRLAGVRI